MTRPPFLRHRALTIGRPRLPSMLALLFAISSIGLLSTPSAALAWDPGSFSGDSEARLVTLHNQARASAGKGTLKMDATLRTVARWRAKDLAERDYFSHTIKGTDRNAFWYMQYEYGYCFKLAGENLGTLAWEGASEEEATNWIFDAWMKSSGHRTNILGKAWDAVGIGAYQRADGTFLWVALFADKCGGTSPAATPKPTPKATPRPTARPTPKPTPRPTLPPTPEPTASRDPAPSPNAIPSPVPSGGPESPEAATPSGESLNLLGPSPSPTSVPWTQAGSVASATGFRIVDHRVGTGLVDSILMSVVGPLFGT